MFEIVNGSSTVTTLASFNGTNGSTPLSGVVLDGQGNLYGTTITSGASNDGTVFEIVKGSGTITTLASFNGTNGATPLSGLVLDSQGNLYGTTSQGGASNDGTVFEIVKGSNTITTLATFDGTNGAKPFAGLVLDGQGNLYGTTSQGGASNDGTVFKLVHSTATQLMVSRHPPQIVGLDNTFDVQISAEVPSGNVDTSFNGPVTIALDNNPGDATLGGTLTVNAVNGVADFPDLTLNKAGSGYTLQATSAGLTSVDTGPFTVSYIVTNTSDSQPGSLRDMITAVDADPIANGPDQITFAGNISGGTIALQGPLPALTRDYVSITGPITLDGGSAGAGDGLDIAGSQDSVQNLAITSFRKRGRNLHHGRSTIRSQGTEITYNQNGVLVSQGAIIDCTIGGTAAGAGNVINRNTSDGIDLNGAQGTTIQGNWIGTDSSGDTGLGNGEDGINIENGASASIIGLTVDDTTTPVAKNPSANVIANNGGNGVSILGGTGDTIRGNTIYGNGGPTHQGLAISLGGGTTYKPNTLTPFPSDPNEDVNYPGLSVTPLGTLLTLVDLPNETYRFDFYLVGCNTSSFVASHSGTTDEYGTFYASIPNLPAVPDGMYLTVTATDEDGNTSEMLPVVGNVGNLAVPSQNIPPVDTSLLDPELQTALGNFEDILNNLGRAALALRPPTGQLRIRH